MTRMRFLAVVVFKLMIGLVTGRGTLFVGLLGFLNPSNRTFDGTCCGEENSTVCYTDCRLLFDITVIGLGQNETKSPLDTPVSGSKVISIPPSNEMKNPLSFSFQKWPGEVTILVSIYDLERKDKSLVDIFNFTFKYGKPELNYKNETIYGMRPQNETVLRLILRYNCDIFYFEKEDCSRFCLLDNFPCLNSLTGSTNPVTDWVYSLSTAKPSRGRLCPTIHPVSGITQLSYINENTENCTNDLNEKSTLNTGDTTSTTKDPVTSPTKDPVTFTTKDPVTSPTKDPVTFTTKDPVTSTTKDPVTYTTKDPVTSPMKDPVTSPTKYPVTFTTKDPITFTKKDPVTISDMKTSTEVNLLTTITKTIKLQSTGINTDEVTVSSTESVFISSSTSQWTSQEETTTEPLVSSSLKAEAQISLTPSRKTTKNNPPTNRVAVITTSTKPTTLKSSTQQNTKTSLKNTEKHPPTKVKVDISTTGPSLSLSTNVFSKQATYQVSPNIPDGGPKTIDDDVMHYWPAIVGGVLGIIAVIAVLGVFVYVRKLRVQQKKRQDIYNVNPQTWILETNENGTSGMSEIALETEEV